MKTHLSFTQTFIDPIRFYDMSISVVLWTYPKMCHQKILTLQEAASGMHPEWQGGADSARPYKNQFRGHFDPIF